MKQFLILAFTGILLLCFCGCAPTTPKSVAAKGTAYLLSKGNSITVTEAAVEENCIVIAALTDFSTMDSSVLKELAVRKAETGQKEIFCHVEKTVQRNGYDIFSQTGAETGTQTQTQTVFLVFADEEIQQGAAVSSYVLTVPAGVDAQGNTVRKDAVGLG